VDGSLTLITGASSINNGTLQVKRDIICSNLSQYTAGAGSALIKLISDGSPHTITGASGCTFPQLEIATNTDNVTLIGNINILGDYTNLLYKVSSVGTLTTTGSTLTIMNAPTVFVPGAHMYNNVTFNASTHKSLQGATMNVGGTLTLLGYNSFSNGALNVYGNLNVDSIDPFSMNGDLVVTLKGNPSGQTVSSNTHFSTIPNLIIDTGSNPVTFGTNVAVSGNMQILTVGTLTTTGSTLYMKVPSSDVSLDLKGIAIENINVSNAAAGYGVNLASDLTVNGTLTGTNIFIKMFAKNLSANAISLSNSSITKSGGVLTVGGSVVGTGSMYGGTVNP
ncbi:MAG: hypothetical protein L6Q37_13930, partial [Bdellovibrionaceae bacterium]|nr:hypothetical protein [Pseudobdellovibrionaceae bacterium]